MRKFVPTALIYFLVSVHFGALLYVASSYLKHFFPENIVSLLFTLSALVNVAFYPLATPLLKRFSKGAFLTIFLLTSTLSSLGLAYATNSVQVLFYFFLYGPSILMVYYCLDLILETLTNEKRTGEIRGLYNTFLNTGIMVGPLLLALFSLDDSLNYVYIVAALALIPALIIAAVSFKLRFTTPHRGTVTTLKLPIRDWWRKRNIRAVTLARLSLESFFTFMIIYTPLYLHDTIDFSWGELGIIFTVALLPFVIFTWPVGEIADKFLGEKEIMSLGFFLAGVATIMMSFVGKNFIAWMFILFLSRVGASFVEITTDVYFFKKIHPHDTGILSIFRLTRPLSNAMGALMGLVLLEFFSIDKVFFLTAFLLLFGLRETLYIKDTL